MIMILVSISRFSRSRNSFLALFEHLNKYLRVKKAKWLPRWPPSHIFGHISASRGAMIMILVSISMFSRSRNSFLALFEHLNKYLRVKKAKWLPRWLPSHNVCHISASRGAMIMILVSISRFSVSRNSFLALFKPLN
jgi:hypothetical protein